MQHAFIQEEELDANQKNLRGLTSGNCLKEFILNSAYNYNLISDD